MSCLTFLRAAPRRGVRPAWLLPAALAGALACAISLPPLVKAATTISEVLVPASGRVRGATEDVTFSGQVRIQTAVIPDTEGKEPPVAEVTVDFSGVKGSGVATHTAYVAPSSVTMHRHVVPAETIEVTFPYYPAGKPLAAQSAMATFEVYNGAKASASVVIKTNAPPPAN